MVHGFRRSDAGRWSTGRKYAAGAGLFCLGLFLSGCCGLGLEEDCECDETAQIKFTNRSNSTTYDVVLDGSLIGAIAETESITRTVPAGEHTLVFKFANGNNACTPSSPNVGKCQNREFSCGADD